MFGKLEIRSRHELATALAVSEPEPVRPELRARAALPDRPEAGAGASESRAPKCCGTE